MTKKLDRAGWTMLALALFPVGSSLVRGTDLQRLPPVESVAPDAPPAKPILPLKRNPTNNDVAHSVWNEVPKGDRNPIQLVANNELYIPPVFVAADPNASAKPIFSTAQVPTSATPESRHNNPLRTQQSSRAAVPVASQSTLAKPLEAAAQPTTQPTMQLVSQSTTQSTTVQPTMQPASRSTAQPTTQLAAQGTTQPATQPATPPVTPPAANPFEAVPPTSQPPATAPATAPTPPEPPVQTPADTTGEIVAPGIAVDYSEDDCAAPIPCESSCCVPCWYVQANSLMLFRSDVETTKIVEEGTGTPPRGQRNALLTTDALDPDPAWGPWVTIGHVLDECRNIEASYYGFQHWQSTAAFDGVNGVGFSFNNIDVPFDSNFSSDWDGGQYVSAVYSSEIQNAEINLVSNNRWDLNSSHGFPWYHYADFLAGVRYFNLNEEFNLESTDTGDTSNYLIETTNHLVGGQLGVVFGTYFRPNLSWNITSKAGLYMNFAEQDTWLGDDANTVVLRDFNTSGENLAFLGDTSFTLSWDIRPNLALTGGYYLLYVGGVALAPEQLDFTTTATSGSGLNTSGGAFYHGAIAGLTFVF